MLVTEVRYLARLQSYGIFPEWRMAKYMGISIHFKVGNIQLRFWEKRFRGLCARTLIFGILILDRPFFTIF